MKNIRKKHLEHNRKLFFILGFCISCGISFLAFEWKSYKTIENKTWIPIDDYIDTLDIIPAISIPQPNLNIPNKKELIKSNKIESVKIDITDLINTKSDSKIAEANDEIPLFEDDETDDGSDPIEPLGFKLEVLSPDQHPYFTSGKCQKLKNNKEKYFCSLNYIRQKIRENLFIPEYISNNQNFTILFKIDTGGNVFDIEVIGLKDPEIINSAKKIFKSLPTFSPPIHNGEKRVMKSSLRVQIKID